MVPLNAYHRLRVHSAPVRAVECYYPHEDSWTNSLVLYIRFFFIGGPNKSHNQDFIDLCEMIMETLLIQNTFRVDGLFEMRCRQLVLSLPTRPKFVGVPIVYGGIYDLSLRRLNYFLFSQYIF